VAASGHPAQRRPARRRRRPLHRAQQRRDGRARRGGPGRLAEVPEIIEAAKKISGTPRASFDALRPPLAGRRARHQRFDARADRSGPLHRQPPSGSRVTRSPAPPPRSVRASRSSPGRWRCPIRLV
jgi:hypothetical protein